tara:strand:+ start:22463 stop:22993 length:531 start_codon:yes stop_codon:yes gene_type:complete
MPFTVSTIAPTVSDNAHDPGDVMFNLTEVKLPARACKLISCFAEVENGGGETDTKIGILFFKKNTTAALGDLNATADISAANFLANEYIGQAFIGLHNGNSELQLTVGSTGLYYPMAAFADSAASGADGEHFSVFEPMVLQGDAGSSVVYAGGVIHDGAPDFDGTANVKIHFHFEY